MIDTCESPDTSYEIRWIAVVDVFYDSVMELIINSVEHMWVAINWIMIAQCKISERVTTSRIRDIVTNCPMSRLIESISIRFLHNNFNSTSNLIFIEWKSTYCFCISLSWCLTCVSNPSWYDDTYTTNARILLMNSDLFDICF